MALFRITTPCILLSLAKNLVVPIHHRSTQLTHLQLIQLSHGSNMTPRQPSIIQHLALNLNGVASSATHLNQLIPLGPSLAANMVVGSESSSQTCVKMPKTLLDPPDLHEAGKTGKQSPLLETFGASLTLSAVKYQLNRSTSSKSDSPHTPTPI